MPVLQKLKIYFFAPRYRINRFQLNTFGFIFITVGLIAGVYIATYKVLDILALDELNHNWNFVSETSPQYTTSLSTIDNNGAHPESGINKISNSGFSAGSEGGSADSWTTMPIVGSSTPAGFVPVPGNDTYMTDGSKKAFLAAQYEAKYDCTGDGNGDTATACGAAATSGAGLDYRDLTFNKANVVSTADGAPIVHITHDQALDACPTGYHLITNEEWMTIARNAEVQTVNWADGVVGSTVGSGGGLKRGNVALTDSVSYNATTDPDYGTSRNTKARLELSNGAQLWDLSGNVFEHFRFSTSDSKLSMQDHPEATTDGTTAITDATSAWSEFTDANPNRRLLNDGTNPPLGTTAIRSSVLTYNSTQGIGKVYHWSNSSSTTKDRVAARGGGWGHTTSGGLYTIFLSNAPGYQDINLGCRCASDTVDAKATYSSTSGRSGGANTVTIGAVGDLKMYQSVNVGDTSTYDFSAYIYNLAEEGGDTCR